MFGSRVSLFATVAALCLAVSPALADGTAVMEAGSPEGRMSLAVAWSDAGALRVDMPGQPTYTLLRDGKAYVVTDLGGGAMVMDLTSMLRMGGSGVAPGGGLGLDGYTAAVVTDLRATGASETVAGLRGEVYEITWTDHAGAAHTDEIVLSDDPLALALSRVMQAYAETLGQNIDARGAAVTQRGMGVLRYGRDFRLAEISGRAVSPDRFELPAPPMDMQQMMQGVMGRQ